MVLLRVGADLPEPRMPVMAVAPLVLSYQLSAFGRERLVCRAVSIGPSSPVLRW